MRSLRAGGAHACCVRVCVTEPGTEFLRDWLWLRVGGGGAAAGQRPGAGGGRAVVRRLPGEGPGRAGWGRRPRCMPGQSSARGALRVVVSAVTARFDQSSDAWEACRENTRKVLPRGDELLPSAAGLTSSGDIPSLLVISRAVRDLAPLVSPNLLLTF